MKALSKAKKFSKAADALIVAVIIALLFAIFLIDLVTGLIAVAIEKLTGWDYSKIYDFVQVFSRVTVSVSVAVALTALAYMTSLSPFFVIVLVAALLAWLVAFVKLGYAVGVDMSLVSPASLFARATGQIEVKVFKVGTVIKYRIDGQEYLDFPFEPGPVRLLVSFAGNITPREEKQVKLELSEFDVTYLNPIK